MPNFLFVLTDIINSKSGRSHRVEVCIPTYVRHIYSTSRGRMHNAICAQLKRLILKCIESESVHNLHHKAPCRLHTFTHIYVRIKPLS